MKIMNIEDKNGAIGEGRNEESAIALIVMDIKGKIGRLKSFLGKKSAKAVVGKSLVGCGLLFIVLIQLDFPRWPYFVESIVSDVFFDDPLFMEKRYTVNPDGGIFINYADGIGKSDMIGMMTGARQAVASLCVACILSAAGLICMLASPRVKPKRPFCKFRESPVMSYFRFVKWSVIVIASINAVELYLAFLLWSFNEAAELGCLVVFLSFLVVFIAMRIWGYVSDLKDDMRVRRRNLDGSR